MLNLTASLPGQGKTTWVSGKLQRDIENGITPILIVPEQFHFETERAIYRTLGARSMPHIKIVSFTKLSAEIVSRYGAPAPYADDIVKEVLMSCVLRENEDKLEFYSAYENHREKNLPRHILGILSSFRRAAITPQLLHNTVMINPDDRKPLTTISQQLLVEEREYIDEYFDELERQEAEKEGRRPRKRGTLTYLPRMRRRLTDLAVLYEAFEEALGEKLSDRLDDTRAAAGIAQQRGLFSGKNIYIDGFDGFTGGQLVMLKVMVAGAASVSVTLLADPSEWDKLVAGRNSRFPTVLPMRLSKLAERVGTSFELLDLTKAPIFPERTPTKKRLTVAPDLHEECAYIATEILRLISTRGYKLGEIAVIMPQRNDSVDMALGSAFETYGIAHFSDLPTPIVNKPLVRFVLDCLAATTLEAGAMQRYIKSGFVRVGQYGIKPDQKSLRAAAGRLKLMGMPWETGVEFTERRQKSRRMTDAEIHKLALVARVRELSGGDWYAPLPRQIDKIGITEDMEPLRIEIITALTKFSDKLNDATGAEMITALADFLMHEMEVHRTIFSMVNNRELAYKKGFDIDASLNDEYRQLWELIVTVFESLHFSLGKRSVGRMELVSLLEKAFELTRIARPPQVIDAVTVADMERSRTAGVKVAFVLGACQGAFPKNTALKGPFSSKDADALNDFGLELPETSHERHEQSRFVMNRVLQLPTERLYLSYHMRDAAYRPCEPSAEVEKLGRAWGVDFISTRTMPVSFFARTPKAAVREAARKADDPEALAAVREAIALLEREQEIIPEKKYPIAPNGYDRSARRALTRVAKGLNFRGRGRQYHQITPEQARTLLGRRSMSPSGIEQMNTCLFKYFCEAGLNVRPPEELGFTPLDRGNMVHYVLDRVLREYQGREYEDFLDLSGEELEAAALAEIRRFIEEKKPAGGRRRRVIMESYAGGLARLFAQLQTDMETTGFRPYALEGSVDFELGGVRIKGRPDRIDKLEEDGHILVRVIDYKTGTAPVRYPEVYYGLRIQSLLYLFGVIDGGEPGVISGDNSRGGVGVSVGDNLRGGVGSSVGDNSRGGVGLSVGDNSRGELIPGGAYYQPGSPGSPSKAGSPLRPGLSPTSEEAAKAWLGDHATAGVAFQYEPAARALERLENVYQKQAGGGRARYIKAERIPPEAYGSLKNHIGDVIGSRLDQLKAGQVFAVPVRDKVSDCCRNCAYKGFCGRMEDTVIEKEAILSVVGFAALRN